MQNECEGCKYNREMKDRGETFMACWFEHDMDQELYEVDGQCSGYINPDQFGGEQLTLF